MLPYFISMDFFSKQNLYEKIQWVKEKGSWLLLAILTAALVFFAAFWFTLLLLFLLQPEPYAAKVQPQFQAKRQSNIKLFSVLENRELKTQFCNQETFTYAGTSIGQEEFCNFNYQKMPRLNGPYDIQIIGLNSIEVRFVSVCALRLPKYRKTIQLVYNQSEAYQVPSFPPYRYVCQKYRAYKHFQIANALDDIELVFLEVELELTQKGYESFDGANLRLSFQQESTAAQRFIIDYYWILALVVAFGAGVWIGAAVLVIELAVIVRRILTQKQIQELRLLQQRNLKRE